MAENKKPLSLNERHSRLLQDLSASHSRPPPMSSSNIPSIGTEKPSKIKLEGRRRLYKSFSEDQNPAVEDDDAVPQFSGIADFDSPLEEEKPQKPELVKLEGRRRLCKASTRDVDDHLVPNFSQISDFDSPPTAKNREACENEGANEIRDILDDLSSRLEFLSVEKKRSPMKVDSIGNYSLGLLEDEASEGQKIANHSRIGDGGVTGVEVRDKGQGLSTESESDSFDRAMRVPVSSQGHKKIGVGMVDERKKSMDQIMVSDLDGEVEEEADDDDCVVLSNRGLVKKAGRQGSKCTVQPHCSNSIDALVGDYTDDSVSKDPASYTLSGPKSTYRLPGKIANMLYPHQRDGLKWLWSLHCQGKGGILGDDMGLGKTMQICGFLAGLFHSCLIKRALVVAPKTLLSHWIKELSVVGLSDKTKEYYGTCAKARQYELQYVLQDRGVLLTTYDIVRNNSKSLRGDFYFDYESSEDNITWDYMILDEGHLIKNPSTQRAKSLLEIPSAHRIIMSGTPLQNNLKELWALFNFCCPELLGDKHWFKEKYEYKILRGNDKNATGREKHIGSTTAKELRERIQPYFLRRLKSEVFQENNDTNTAKLSKKNEMIVWLKLTSCQRQLYEAFLNSELVLSAFDGSPLAALTILKKICDHPMLLTKRAAEDVLEGMDSMLNQDDMGMAEKLAMHIADITDKEKILEKHDDVSCKISFILSLLDNLIPEGHNVLIFSQTRKMLNLIQESLTLKGYKYLRIDGTTKSSDRVKIVNEFQEGSVAPIFLLTSQVGGLGLTLTNADRVIVVDPAWNPSTDNQSVDRAYRIGQKKDVLVYRLMTCGTVEEKIYRKQIYKGGLFKTATEQKEQIRYFSQQDLKELFSLPKQGFDLSLTQQQLHEEHDSEHTMDDYLTNHIKFLETQGIAGVSHHSLLFSKTAPAPVAEDDEENRRKAAMPVRIPYLNSSMEQSIDGAMYAFNPKDVNLHRKSSPADSPNKPTELDIKAKINRVAQILADKGTISKLPDKGQRLQRQLVELNLELNRMRTEKRLEKEVIDLDDVTDELQRVLNV